MIPQSNRRPLEELRSGQLDIGFFYATEHSSDRDVSFTPLFSLAYYVLMNPNCPLADRKALHLADLKGQSVVSSGAFDSFLSACQGPSLEELAQAVREDTILVSVMYVNNEIGAVEPVEEISKVIKAKNPKTLFHVDAIQAYGKYVIRPKKQGIDLLSVSGHKIHGPKGVGFLYIDEKAKVRPILFGGGQQKGMRSGTENVPGCAGLGAAVREVYRDHEAKIEKLYQIRERLIAGLKELPGVTINGHEGRENAPQIVSASFEGVRSEVLLHALEDRGVYVSSGSACSVNHPGVSGTLKGIGVKKELLDSTIRFSFGLFNEPEEADYCLEVLRELLPVLRRYRAK